MNKADVAAAASCAAMLALLRAAVAQAVSSLFDPVIGQTVDQTSAVVSDGLASFNQSASFGPEVAPYLRKQQAQESLP